MQNKYNKAEPSNFDDEINLTEMFRALFEGKWIIISVTTFISIIGIIYSLYLPNIYQSKAILVPVNSSSGISAAMKSYGSLAGLAGINLPASNDESNTTKAIKKLGSLSFFEKNVMPNIFLPNLMALKSWDISNNKIIYKNDIYLLESNTWVRDYIYPYKQIPSAQESFRVFKSKHFSISEDVKTGFITLSINHQSPFIAKKWTELLVNEINSFYRQQDKLESEKTLIYLNNQIAKTNLTEIKQVIAQLLQQETQKLALVEAKQFYVFDYIDPPAVMEKKSEPKRAIICFIFAICGGMVSILIVLLKHYGFRKKIN